MSKLTSHDISQWLKQGAVCGQNTHIDLFWGQDTRSSIPVGYPSVFSSDFYLKENKPWHSYTHCKRVEASSIPRDSRQEDIELQWEPADKSLFEEQFLRVQELMRKGELQKIVLTTEIRAPKTQSPEVFLKRALGPIPEHRYVYGLWNEPSGFLGYTPEVLFEVEAPHTVKTMALAGTSAPHAVEHTLQTSKNQKEHEWVIQDITHQLKDLGIVSVGETQILDLKTLVHFLTPLSIKLLQKIDITSLISLFHPTAALGVFPRERWRDLKNWRSDYDAFGAPFVWAQGESHALGLVGIRQLAWDKEFYYIRSGCGVVIESSLEEEWSELQLKMNSVKKMMGCRL